MGKDLRLGVMTTATASLSNGENGSLVMAISTQPAGLATDSGPDSGSDIVVRTDGLTKHDGSLVTLDPLDLQVRRGEVLGYLGPNGRAV
jgi:hypothetical protein